MPCCIGLYGFFCHKDAQVVFVFILEVLNFKFFTLLFNGKFSNENSRSCLEIQIHYFAKCSCPVMKCGFCCVVFCLLFLNLE